MSNQAELVEIEKRIRKARGGIRRALEQRAAYLRAKAGRK